MAQYLDNAGLVELVKKTKEFANNRVKVGVTTPASLDGSKTITGWDDATSAAIYSDIKIAESQVTNLVKDLGLKAPLASPAFTGVPTVPDVDITASGTQQIANTKYVKDLVGNIGEAMHYKGAVTLSEGLPQTGYVAGDTYKVAEAGTYAGKVCELGDMIIANKTYAEGASNADWDVIQTNIDGAVTGPVGATSGNLAMFDNSNGKVIADAGLKLSDLKTKQSAYTASSGTLATLTAISQNANGEIEATFQDIQSATTSQKGVVQLAGSIGATVSEENNKAATEKAVREAINALDVSDISGFGKGKTLATLTETDGKIAATFQDIQIAESQVDGLVDDLGNIATSAADLNTKIDAVSGAVATSAAALDAKITAVSGAVDNLDAVVTSTDGKNVQVKVTEVDGKITGVNITTDNTVNATDITTAIDALDFGPYAVPTSGTITSIKETNGVIEVSSGAILISSAQVSDLGDVLGNYKTVQTAVSDPTADGTGITFIDSASQDTNGVITLHKKTVQNASGSQPGLMSAADFTKLSQISTSANRVEVDQSTGVLSIDGSSAMGPISTTDIANLFV